MQKFMSIFPNGTEVSHCVFSIAKTNIFNIEARIYYHTIFVRVMSFIVPFIIHENLMKSNVPFFCASQCFLNTEILYRCRRFYYIFHWNRVFLLDNFFVAVTRISGGKRTTATCNHTLKLIENATCRVGKESHQQVVISSNHFYWFSYFKLFKLGI